MKIGTGKPHELNGALPQHELYTSLLTVSGEFQFVGAQKSPRLMTERKRFKNGIYNDFILKTDVREGYLRMSCREQEDYTINISSV